MQQSQAGKEHGGDRTSSDYQRKRLGITRAQAAQNSMRQKRKGGNTAPGRPKNTGAPKSPSVDKPNTEKGRTDEQLAKLADNFP